MKIGVVTFWETQDNYGQVLQCYALIKFLRTIGHEAFLIRYRRQNSQLSLSHFLEKAMKYILRPSSLVAALKWRKMVKVASEDNRAHPRDFDGFRTRYIPGTRDEYDDEKLKSCPPEADVYVCGSDQVWGTMESAYFLQFGRDDVKRIAYAPSMGGRQPQGRIRQQMMDYLSKFDYISSREEAGVEVLSRMGFKADLQPDPTLLLPPSDYRELVNPLRAERPYVLLYLLGNAIAVDVSSILLFVQQKGLEIRYVASQGRTDSHPKIYPTVEEWLGLIDGATCVLTNSFHAAVFCLQLNTPFLVFPIRGGLARMNNRIYDLLQKYGMQQRIYDGNLGRMFDKIDFTMFNKTRSEEVDRVSELFMRILSSNNEENF